MSLIRCPPHAISFLWNYYMSRSHFHLSNLLRKILTAFLQAQGLLVQHFWCCLESYCDDSASEEKPSTFPSRVRLSVLLKVGRQIAIIATVDSIIVQNISAPTIPITS